MKERTWIPRGSNALPFLSGAPNVFQRPSGQKSVGQNKIKTDPEDESTKTRAPHRPKTHDPTIGTPKKSPGPRKGQGLPPKKSHETKSKFSEREQQLLPSRARELKKRSSHQCYSCIWWSYQSSEWFRWVFHSVYRPSLHFECVEEWHGHSPQPHGGWGSVKIF